MKIVITFIFVLFLLITKLNAQVEKGNFSVGIATSLNAAGDDSIFGFGYTVNDGQRETFQLNLAPRFGYVIRKNLNVGLDVVVSYSNTPENKSTFIAGGPFARYYFRGNYLRPYLELQGSYGNFNIKSDSPFFGNQDFNVRYLLGGTAFGLAFPIKNIVHIDIAAAFNYRFGNFVEDDIVDNSYAIGLKVGVTVFLVNKKTVNN